VGVVLEAIQVSLDMDNAPNIQGGTTGLCPYEANCYE